MLYYRIARFQPVAGLYDSLNLVVNGVKLWIVTGP